MANDIQASSIDKLTTEILILKQQTAQNIIEIGRRLIEVKERLPHGGWLPWLNDTVEFSQQTANNFMRVAREYSNYQSLGNLPPTKIFALLDVPVDEREIFVSQSHELPSGEIKTVDEMTTRELQAAIKAKKEAEARSAQLESTLRGNEQRTQMVEAELDRVEAELQRLKSVPPEVRVVETRVEVVPGSVQLKLQELEAIKSKQGDINSLEQTRQKLQSELTNLRQEVYQMSEKYGEGAREAAFLALIKKGCTPLSEVKGQVEQVARSGVTVSNITVKHIRAYLNVVYDFARCVEDALNTFTSKEEEADDRPYFI